jgi:hypothetical protein
MKWSDIINEILTAPSLRPAIRHAGKIYSDGTPRVDYMMHRDVLHAMPLDVRRAAMGDPDNRGFITPTGRFLDREQAAVYARRNHLWSKNAPDHVVNARIFASEWLYLYGNPSAYADHHRINEVATITESPIGDIHTHGDFTQPGSLRKDDLSLTTPKRQNKIKQVLQKAPVLIDLHFVNQKNPIDIDQHLKQPQWGGGIGFTSPEQLQLLYNITITANPHAVNIVMLQNEGDERLPLTPWIIGHRIGHLLYHAHQLDFEEIFRKFFSRLEGIQVEYKGDSMIDLPFPVIAKVFGTTRACREGMIRAGRVAEWVYECFAQMCVIGTIAFNPAPPTIGDGKATYTTDETLYVNKLFGRCRAYLLEEFTKLLKQTIGQIVVF